MHPLLGTALGLVILAATFGGVAAAASRDALARNGSLGIRTRATLTSDDAWLAGHRASVPWLQKAAGIAGAVALLAIGVMVWASDDVQRAASVTAPFVGYGGSLAMMLLGVRAANRAARAA